MIADLPALVAMRVAIYLSLGNVAERVLDVSQGW